MYTRQTASVLLFVVALPATAWAAPDDVFQFLWTHGVGTESCPSQEKVARKVAAKLGRDPFEDGSARTIRGRIDKVADEWVVHLDQFDGEKVVDTRDGSSTATDCAETLSMAAFLVTRLIETDQNESKPETNGPPKSPPKDAIPAKSLVLVPPRTTTKPGSSLFVGTNVQIGLLPRASIGTSVGGSAGKGNFEGSFGMVFLPAVDTSDGIYSFGMTAGWLGGCIRTRSGRRVTFLACAELFGGVVHSIVNDIETFDRITPGERGWFGASGSAHVRVSLYGPFSFEFGTHIMASVTRLGFTVDPGDASRQTINAFHQPPIAAIPFVRAGWSFF